MPENKVEDELNRENVQSDAVIISSSDEKKYFDFLDFIETSNHESAEKIRKAMQYISEEELLTIYQSKAETIETEEQIENYLEEIFVTLANYINELPNGIVIDFATGLKDPGKSFEQAMAVGIYPEDLIMENTNDFIIAGIEELSSKLSFDEQNDLEYVLNNYEFKYIGDNDIKDDINNFLNKDINKMKLSASLKNVVNRDRKLIANSKYENDMHLYEISRLEMNLEAAKGTPLYNHLLSRRAEFYEKYPKYIGKVPVRNSDGTINKDEATNVDDFRESYERMFMLEHIDTFNSMSLEEFSNLPEEEKRHVIIGAFASFKYNKSDSREYQEIATESKEMIKQLYPELDLNNENQLAEFLKNEMGFKENIDNLSLNVLTEIASRQLGIAMDEYIAKDTQKYIDRNSDFTTLDLNKASKSIYGSAMQDYFVGSNINFSDSDEKSYIDIYQYFTISSWIESKDEAIKLSYMAILDAKENYRKKYGKDNPNINLVKYDNKLKSMEKNFGKIDIDENIVKGDMPFDMYKQSFINAGLTKYYTRDAIKFQKGTSYEQLSKAEKREYIMNTIVGLKYAEGNPNFSVSKIALRRLEVMSTEDRKFVEFDEDGTPRINKALITEEFQTILGHKCESYEALQDVAERQKERYFLKKLREYTELDEKDFLKLDDSSDLERSMEQIEEIRIKSNTERIQQKVAESNQRTVTQQVATKQNERQQSESELIGDQDFDRGIASGILNPVNLSVLARKAKKVVRELRVDDQKEISDDMNNANAGNDNTDLKVEQIDSSAIVEDEQSKKVGFIGAIKQAIDNVKGFLSKYIGKKEKVKELGKGNDISGGSIGTSTSNVTKVEETTKLSEMFNKSLSAGLTLQEQQEYSIRQQMQQTAKNDTTQLIKAEEGSVIEEK